MNKLNLTQTELESLESLTFHSVTISKFVRDMYYGKVEGTHVYSALNKLRDYVLAELVTINKPQPIKRYLWANKRGFIYRELLSETEVLGLEYRLPTSEKFTIKLQWSETEFEAENV